MLVGYCIWDIKKLNLYEYTNNGMAKHTTIPIGGWRGRGWKDQVQWARNQQHHEQHPVEHSTAIPTLARDKAGASYQWRKMWKCLAVRSGGDKPDQVTTQRWSRRGSSGWTQPKSMTTAWPLQNLTYILPPFLVDIDAWSSAAPQPLPPHSPLKPRLPPHTGSTRTCLHLLVFRCFMRPTSPEGCSGGSPIWGQRSTLPIHDGLGMRWRGSGRGRWACPTHLSCISWCQEPGDEYAGDIRGWPGLPSPRSTLSTHHCSKATPPWCHKIYPTINLAIANSGKGAKHACLLYPEDESEYPVSLKIQREVRNHRKEGGVHE